jgi:hypothetical protein
MTLRKKLSDELSLKEINETMAFLVDEVGERLSGTGEMRKATEYLRDRLIGYGVDAWIDHFPMYMSYPGEARLKMLLPEAVEFKARPVGHIRNTGAEGISGELIYVGSGGYTDYEGIDPTEKIILTDMTWSPGRPEKARIAWELGAKALIIMNWGKSDDDLIQMGAVKTQWGNPTPQSEKEIVDIPVISISRKDGERLAGYCSSGEVKIWMTAEATREWIQADQTTAFIKGGESNGQFVVVGSHVDAWGKSAICNASGDAVNVELARLMNKYRDQLKRDAYFVFWDGHEIAECGGSTWFCDTHWMELDKNCLGYINIDNLAIAGTSIPGVESQPELKEYLMKLIQEVWGEEGVFHQAYKGGGDSSFFGVGVPYISFATEYTEEQLKELNYAFYGPYLHTDFDTVDKVDQYLLFKHALYDVYVLHDFLQADVIPYNLSDLAKEIRGQYDEIKKRAGDALELISFLEPVFGDYVKACDAVSAAVKKRSLPEDVLNKVLLRFDRSTAIFRCEAGRYGQDGCCYVQTEEPIPYLEKALRNYNGSAAGTHEKFLWETEVMRVANRVYDTLANPLYYWEAVEK